MKFQFKKILKQINYFKKSRNTNKKIKIITTYYSLSNNEKKNLKKKNF